MARQFMQMVDQSPIALRYSNRSPIRLGIPPLAVSQIQKTSFPLDGGR